MYYIFKFICKPILHCTNRYKTFFFFFDRRPTTKYRPQASLSLNPALRIPIIDPPPRPPARFLSPSIESSTTETVSQHTYTYYHHCRGYRVCALTNEWMRPVGIYRIFLNKYEKNRKYSWKLTWHRLILLTVNELCSPNSFYETSPSGLHDNFLL